MKTMSLNPTNARPLKIGYIMQANAADMFTVSGPQLHVSAVVQGLQKRGHQVRMVAIQQKQILWTDDLQNWRPGEFRWSKSPLFRLFERPLRGTQRRLHLPYFRLFDSYRFSDACVSALAGYDILYERDGIMSYGGLIAAHRLGVPIVLEINGDLVEEWQQIGIQWSKMQERIVHFITRHTYRQSTHLVAVGETIRQRLIQRWGLAPSHVSVVTNGAEIDLFLSPASETASTRARYGIGEGPVIIFTGSFQPWHGVDLILEGFRQLADAMPQAQMVFVGDGQLRPELAQNVKALGLEQRIVFTGRVPHTEVARLLHLADVAVIYQRTSAAEIVETPLKLFEYMAAGKAIIAPAVPNMQRILTDGVSGVLIPPDNPPALARAIMMLLGAPELRNSLGQVARQEAIEKHSWSRAVSELESILYCLIDRPRNE
jgi:glycogen(starch) synthase